MAKKTGRGAPAKSASRKKKTARPARLTAKQLFLERFVREHAVTLKLLRALPVNQSEFRPHPRSQSAREIALTFVMEQAIITRALTGQPTMGGGAGAPKVPEDFRAIVLQFAGDYHALVELIKKTPEKEFYSTVKFPTGPGQIGDWTKLAFAWHFLCDQIHHRGQLSVYVRMAGGKVPSIYGPSGDETWR